MFKCGQLDVVVVDAACILYPVALARFAVTREAAGMLGKGWFGCKQKGQRGGSRSPVDICALLLPCCAVSRATGRGENAGAKLAATIEVCVRISPWQWRLWRTAMGPVSVDPQR